MKTFFLSLMFAAIAIAQPTLSTPTLAYDMEPSQGEVFVSSATGLTVGMYAYLDRELVKINSISGTTLYVTRGIAGKLTAHTAGVTVYVGPSNGFTFADPAGKCTTRTTPTVPYVNVLTGGTFECTSGTWTQTNGGGAATEISAEVLDTVLAPASDGCIVPTNNGAGEIEFPLNPDCVTSSSTVGTVTSPNYIETVPGALATNNVGSGTISFYRKCIPHSVTVTKLGAYLHAVGGAGSKFGFAVYDTSASKTLIVQSGALDGATGAISLKSATVSSATLTPDCYIFAWAASDASIQVGGKSFNYIDGGGWPGVASVAAYGTAVGTFSTTTGMPSTLGALSGVSFGGSLYIPNLFFGQ